MSAVIKVHIYSITTHTAMHIRDHVLHPSPISPTLLLNMLLYYHMNYIYLLQCSGERLAIYFEIFNLLPETIYDGISPVIVLIHTFNLQLHLKSKRTM